MTILFDSFCWFEYFQGTEIGAKIRSILLSEEEVLASPINLFEVRRKYLEKLPGEAQAKTTYLSARTRLIAVDEPIACLAADLSSKHHLHATDALLYATARANNCRLLTGDPHFKGLPDVEFLEARES